MKLIEFVSKHRKGYKYFKGRPYVSIHQQIILNFLKRCPATLPEIAANTRLNKRAITSKLNRLQHRGYVMRRDGVPDGKKRGKPCGIWEVTEKVHVDD